MGAHGQRGPAQRLGRSLVDTHEFVFVGGLHRSGTSPFAATLARHPEVSGLSSTGVKEDEGQHLQDVLPAARVHGGAGRFALDPGAHLTEDSPLATEANAERLAVQWAPYWDLARPFLMEKSPPTIMRTRLLQALFPRARFVIMVRHPVVVTLSTRKWRKTASLASLFDNWFAAHQTLLGDLGRLTDVQVLKYEHLVQAPRPTLAGLADWLGLHGEVPAVGIHADASAGYEELWQRWAGSRVPWRRAEYARLVERYETRANAFGYSLTDLAACEAFPSPTEV